MISYCNAPAPALFSTMFGHGVPLGLVELHGILPSGERCERYGEHMTREEAQSEGIRQGMLIEFRRTESFVNMCKHFLKFYGPEKVREYAIKEELDFDELMEKLK